MNLSDIKEGNSKIFPSIITLCEDKNLVKKIILNDKFDYTGLLAAKVIWKGTTIDVIIDDRFPTFKE